MNNTDGVLCTLCVWPKNQYTRLAAGGQALKLESGLSSKRYSFMRRGAAVNESEPLPVGLEPNLRRQRSQNAFRSAVTVCLVHIKERSPSRWSSGSRYAQPHSSRSEPTPSS